MYFFAKKIGQGCCIVHYLSILLQQVNNELTFTNKSKDTTKGNKQMSNATINTVTQTEPQQTNWVNNEDGTSRIETTPAGEYTYTANDFANKWINTDCYPYEILEIKSEKTIVVRGLIYMSSTETFMQDNTRETVTLKKAKNGKWYSKGGMKKGTRYNLTNEPRHSRCREF